VKLALACRSVTCWVFHACKLFAIVYLYINCTLTIQERKWMDDCAKWNIKYIYALSLLLMLHVCRSLRRKRCLGKTSWTASMLCLMSGLMSSVAGSTSKVSSLALLTSSTYCQLRPHVSRGNESFVSSFLVLIGSLDECCSCWCSWDNLLVPATVQHHLPVEQCSSTSFFYSCCLFLWCRVVCASVFLSSDSLLPGCLSRCCWWFTLVTGNSIADS